MKTCPLGEKDWQDFLSGDLEERRRTSLAEHIDGCPECRKESEEFRRVLDGAEAVKHELQAALRSVDWDRLPGKVADFVFDRTGKRPAPSLGDRFRWWLAGVRLKPVMAGLGLGVVLGSLAMYLALKTPSAGPAAGEGYFASGEFLDRVELAMARRNTLDYLKKSQYVLHDVFESAGEGGAPGAFSPGQARDLLSKKKYLNAQLERVQMVKAKAICDQIEMLFLELSQISEEISAAEFQRIRGLVEERQLLLKINLVRKELESEI